ncbi:MAG: hypothetical protein ACLR8Y_08395 [Alistipes indistinctus]
MGGMQPLSVERVKEIIRLNRQGVEARPPERRGPVGRHQRTDLLGRRGRGEPHPLR